MRSACWTRTRPCRSQSSPERCGRPVRSDIHTPWDCSHPGRSRAIGIPSRRRGRFAGARGNLRSRTSCYACSVRPAVRRSRGWSHGARCSGRSASSSRPASGSRPGWAATHRATRKRRGRCRTASRRSRPRRARPSSRRAWSAGPPTSCRAPTATSNSSSPSRTNRSPARSATRSTGWSRRTTRWPPGSRPSTGSGPRSGSGGSRRSTSGGCSIRPTTARPRCSCRPPRGSRSISLPAMFAHLDSQACAVHRRPAAGDLDPSATSTTTSRSPRRSRTPPSTTSGRTTRTEPAFADTGEAARAAGA